MAVRKPAKPAEPAEPIPERSTFSKVTSKGQVTIPQRIRAALGIEEGDKLLFSVYGDAILVRKVGDFFELAGSIPVPPELAGKTWKEVRDAAWTAHVRELVEKGKA